MKVLAIAAARLLSYFEEIQCILDAESGTDLYVIKELLDMQHCPHGKNTVIINGTLQNAVRTFERSISSAGQQHLRAGCERHKIGTPMG